MTVTAQSVSKITAMAVLKRTTVVAGVKAIALKGVTVGTLALPCVVTLSASVLDIVPKDCGVRIFDAAFPALVGLLSVIITLFFTSRTERIKIGFEREKFKEERERWAFELFGEKRLERLEELAAAMREVQFLTYGLVNANIKISVESKLLHDQVMSLFEFDRALKAADLQLNDSEVMAFRSVSIHATGIMNRVIGFGPGHVGIEEEVRNLNETAERAREVLKRLSNPRSI